MRNSANFYLYKKIFAVKNYKRLNLDLILFDQKLKTTPPNLEVKGHAFEFNQILQNCIDKFAPEKVNHKVSTKQCITNNIKMP